MKWQFLGMVCTLVVMSWPIYSAPEPAATAPPPGVERMADVPEETLRKMLLEQERNTSFLGWAAKDRSIRYRFRSDGTMTVETRPINSFRNEGGIPGRWSLKGDQLTLIHGPPEQSRVLKMRIKPPGHLLFGDIEFSTMRVYID